MNTDFARRQMVKQQVRAWDVFDENVLEVIAEVPREDFVPPEYKTLAFADAEIPLGRGELMLTPTIVGRILQTLALAGSETVLEIGAGSGFLTACLAKLSARVVSVDLYDDFVASARTNITACDIDNVELMQMDATRQLPDETFDAIAVTGSIRSFDRRYVDALNPGGRLFVVIGDGPAMAATLVTRTQENDWHSETRFETNIAPLVNATSPSLFSF